MPLPGQFSAEIYTHVLLRAQVGAADAEKRIAQAGDPTRAHQQWLLAYIDRRIQPANFAI